VAATQGAGLADALDRLVVQDRRAEEVRRQLEAHLAAPRATARMLALLPALGLLLGIAVGGDPLGWLLGTPLGVGCLVLGILLVVAGLTWASRIVARTERLL
jgi:tight adherence protein B